MFNSTKSILYFSRNKVTVANISTKAPFEIKDKNEFPWATETLPQILLQIKKIVNTKNVRILLSDDLSYVFSIKIPENLKEDEMRNAVFAKIAVQIPESLNDNEWDYKKMETKPKNNELDIVVFAPVKSIFSQITLAMNKSGMKVDMIEPDTIAIGRHKDPMVGLALKENVKGKDEDVLNIELPNIKI